MYEVLSAVCSACLAWGPELRSTSITRQYMALLLDKQGGDPVRVCGLCEAVLVGVRRFCALARASQHTLETFLRQCESSEITEAVLLNNSVRLARSSLLLTCTPGEHTLRATTGHVLPTAVLRQNRNSDIEIEQSDERAKQTASRLVHLNMVHDSDQSDDETLSQLKQRQLEQDESGTRSFSEGHCEDDSIADESKYRNLKIKKLKSRNSGKSRVNGKNDIEKSKDDSATGSNKHKSFVKVTISDEQMWSERAEERCSRWYAGAPYRCTSCLLGYHNQDLLVKHNLTRHDQSLPHECEVCAARSASETAAGRHRALHNRRLRCSLCGTTCRSHRDMWRHSARAHEPACVEPCLLCGRKFTTRPALLYHRRCAHREKSLCKVCAGTFRSGTSFKRHLLVHSGMPACPCPVCGKTYRGKFGLAMHVKTHGPPPPDAYCVECDRQFKHTFQYRRHLKIGARHRERSGDGPSNKSVQLHLL